MPEHWKDESATTPPKDYNLIVPDGWFKLSLDPEDRDRSIIALADQQFQGIDNAPLLKEQMMRELQKTAKDAYQAGGIELYLSTLRVGPLPLSSSLLVSFPMPERCRRLEMCTRWRRCSADVERRRPWSNSPPRAERYESSVQKQLILKPSSATSSPRQPSSSTFLSRRPKSG
ncbi:hypothetical protein [Streptomyces afghaniensis]|uniref:hypothetical protein n=1 Tax=Streptomyces afghaniensis TaxID=66865 RepID=UPI000564C5B9|nr:hypothetical protein [Streptomyces afghaniensis]